MGPIQDQPVAYGERGRRGKWGEAMCMYLCMYVCIYTHTHIYIYTYTQPWVVITKCPRSKDLQPFLV